MQLWFSRETEVTLREQLVTQVVLAILCHDVAAGERLPSTRELARRNNRAPAGGQSGLQAVTSSQFKHKDRVHRASSEAARAAAHRCTALRRVGESTLRGSSR